MNDLPSLDVASSVEASPVAVRSTRKSSMVLMALFILVVMAIWFGFLGWGVVSFVAWIFDLAKEALFYFSA